MADYMEISPELRELIIKHYSRPEIAKSILYDSPNKEVVGSFGGVGYAKRPDTIEYENDVMMLVKKGVTSFHISEETWSDPLSLRPGMSKKEQDSLRIAWDLIIDIDCPHWGISKLITHLITQEIKAHKVANVSVKFSGNKGFHIGIPNESFSENFAEEFPELPRKICEYLLDRIMEKAKQGIDSILRKEHGDEYFEKLSEIFEKPQQELIKKGALNPFAIVEVDTIMLNARHLFRMTYSVNEKSGLVSIPINPDKVLNFRKDIAKIENEVFSRFRFLHREDSVKGEADVLVYNAREFSAPRLHEEEINKRFEEMDEKSVAEMEYEEFKEKIPEKYFPESIKKFLLANFSDGKKRAIFVLKNFLSSVGWDFEEIEKRLFDWNKEFDEPLRESILRGQLLNLKGSMKNGRIMMPPNFDTNTYYMEIIGDHPDYKRAKNPVSLAIRQFKVLRDQEEKEEKKLEKQKKKEDKKTKSTSMN